MTEGTPKRFVKTLGLGAPFDNSRFGPSENPIQSKLDHAECELGEVLARNKALPYQIKLGGRSSTCQKLQK
jgi:hypothetical protein